MWSIGGICFILNSSIPPNTEWLICLCFRKGLSQFMSFYTQFLISLVSILQWPWESNNWMQIYHMPGTPRESKLQFNLIFQSWKKLLNVDLLSLLCMVTSLPIRCIAKVGTMMSYIFSIKNLSYFRFQVIRSLCSLRSQLDLKFFCL